jgi:hypothetical protein
MGLQVFFRPLKGFLAQLLQTTMNSAGFAKDRRFVDRASPRQPAPALQSRPNPNRPLNGKAMTPIAHHTPEATRQFLVAMCAKANSQLWAQGLATAPELAVMAQANLDLATVLDLLRD